MLYVYFLLCNRFQKIIVESILENKPHFKMLCYHYHYFVFQHFFHFSNKELENFVYSVNSTNFAQLLEKFNNFSLDC